MAMIKYSDSDFETLAGSLLLLLDNLDNKGLGHRESKDTVAKMRRLLEAYQPNRPDLSGVEKEQSDIEKADPSAEKEGK